MLPSLRTEMIHMNLQAHLLSGNVLNTLKSNRMPLHYSANMSLIPLEYILD